MADSEQVSDVQIANLALQELGAKRISAFNDKSKNADEVNECYYRIRDAELRKHRWIFATKHSSLAQLADAGIDDEAAAFGRTYAYEVPADCLRLLPPQYAEGNFNWRDWVRAGRRIYTDDDGPLIVHYVARITDPTKFDSLFIPVLALALAYHLCFTITNSNTLKTEIARKYKEALADARRANALERIPEKTVADTWETIRE